eukprot:287024-Rhodomonas_salina.1
MFASTGFPGGVNRTCGFCGVRPGVPGVLPLFWNGVLDWEGDGRSASKMSGSTSCAAFIASQMSVGLACRTAT